MNDPERPLETRLRSGDPEERLAACASLLEHPHAALFLEALCDALGDPDLRVARRASDVLVEAHRRGDGVPALVRNALLRPRPGDHRGDWGRLFAALTLTRIATPGPALLPALVEGLDHPSGSIRWETTRAMVEVGRLYPETVTLLLGLVRHGESTLCRRMAMHGLRELAPDHLEAAEALVAASRDGDADPALVRAALLAMAGLYRPPSQVRTRLEEAAQSRDAGTRAVAIRALGEAEPSNGGAGSRSVPPLPDSGSGTQ